MNTNLSIKNYKLHGGMSGFHGSKCFISGLLDYIMLSGRWLPQQRGTHCQVLLTTENFVSIVFLKKKLMIQFGSQRYKVGNTELHTYVHRRFGIYISAVVMEIRL